MKDKSIEQMIQTIKFYRPPWNKEKVEYLLRWWPHWGAKVISQHLELSVQQVKSKKDRFKIKLLPRNKRICLECRTNTQYENGRSLYCHDCILLKREKWRRSHGVNPQTIYKDDEKWIATLTGGRRTRKPHLIKDGDKSITVKFMIDLWNKQNGMCYYSGAKMVPPIKGKGRNWYTASIDRLSSEKGYVEGNVSWCCWFYNNAKSNMPERDFINMCIKLVKHQGKVL